MYGNSPLGTSGPTVSLSPDERRALRRDLSAVTAQTRELLPPEFAVGSEITDGDGGPRATVAVHPPVGGVVSADYTPQSGSVGISEEQRTDMVHGLAASAALQVKRAMGDGAPAMAQ